jgi:hypothetical protein
VTAVLIVVGAVLELAGLALVAWDVVDARRASMSLSVRDVRGRAKLAMEWNQALPITAVGGAPPVVPPLEERVEKLVRDVEALDRRLDAEAERHVRDHREMTDRFDESVGKARDEVADLRNELRPLIGQAAAGNLWRRGIGVGLFAVGVLVQMAANLASL